VSWITFFWLFFEYTKTGHRVEGLNKECKSKGTGNTWLYALESGICMGGMSQSDFWASCGSTPNTVGLWVPKTGLRVQGPIKACRGSGTQNHLLWYSNNGPATVEGPQTIRKCLYTRPLCTQYKPSQKHPPFPTLHHSTQHPTTPTFAHTSQTCW
jgi:hypothetical protein